MKELAARRVALALAMAVAAAAAPTAACTRERVEPTATTAPATTNDGAAESATTLAAASASAATIPSAPPGASASAATAASIGKPPQSEWCTEGLETLAEDACYFMPDAPRGPRTLLVYLHGVIAPTGRMQAFVQGVVASRARAHGVVALVPRGRRGIGPGKTKDWWAWPTSADSYARYAKDMVGKWLAWKRELEAMIGAPFERTYVAGSSNGAYFVTVLALKGDITADGFGAMSGGTRASFTKASITATSRPPFYVGYGQRDDAKDDPISLAQLLAEAGWKHRVSGLAVGHGAREEYLDEAFALWDAQ